MKRKKVPKQNSNEWNQRTKQSDIPCSWIKTQYCREVNSSQIDLQFQSKSKPVFFCGYGKTDCKAFMKRQKIQKGQYNMEEEKSWKINTIWLEYLLQSHSYQDCGICKRDKSISGTD